MDKQYATFGLLALFAILLVGGVWYHGMMVDAKGHISQKCWFEVCDSGFCFAVQLRNVTTDLFHEADCKILEYKCGLMDYDNSTHYFFKKGCIWDAGEGICNCMI